MTTQLTPARAGRRLGGKVAVVTGASSGIGAATTRALAAQGVALVRSVVSAPASMRQVWNTWLFLPSPGAVRR